jgi:DNA polymerase-3 subunit delta'
MLYPWQSASWQRFTQQYQQQRVPHAVILTGVSGLGQSALAEQMTMLVLCEIQDATAPCGQCHSCQLFLAGNHPDHTLISPEETGKQIKIEQIRELKHKQTLTANVSQWKTAILTPAEAMNINASNSLLKLLEEPQPNTFLILITAEPAHLPITILSRCQKVPLTLPSSETAIAWIQDQGNFEKIEITKALTMAKSAPLAALSLLSDGSLDYLEQVSRDFTTLLQHKANPVQLAQQWQQYDLKLILNYLQLRLKERIVDNTKHQDLRSNPQNWQIYDCMIKTIKLLSSSNNINKVLLIEQFMVSVMDYPTSQNAVLNQ